MSARKTILILGGTGEAREIASRLVGLGCDVTSSLAGRTSSPILPEGRVRIGGFGGIDGLTQYLREAQVSVLIDATHPFAAQISANAAEAAKRAGIPLLRCVRPAWTKPDGAEWVEVADIKSAADALPVGSRVLLTIGRQEVSAFFGRTDCAFVARVIETPDALPAGWALIKDRGPFTLDDEKALLEAHGITHLVSKNSGGDQAAAKLVAAAELGVTVVMVQRPTLPEARSFASVAELIAAVEAF